MYFIEMFKHISIERNKIYYRLKIYAIETIFKNIPYIINSSNVLIHVLMMQKLVNPSDEEKRKSFIKKGAFLITLNIKNLKLEASELFLSHNSKSWA
ncbi:hypothetical protein BpHYR1_015561 [Brachionus plicatilis]|uniref:Uncharacterized protein n=1 Tax=Brachionus plicatilis TaxID=10195 RepID=A0A3M7S4R5_BRAPC|nr:hypothetical protein BpHYR1_015561 [Brachionus plicatilis]